MKPASYATRTLAPLEPLHGSGARRARLFALGGALLAIPNLLVLRCWGLLASDVDSWRMFLAQQESTANLIAHGGYVLVALWGGFGALRMARRVRRARGALRGVSLVWLSCLAAGALPGLTWIARVGGVGG